MSGNYVEKMTSRILVLAFLCSLSVTNFALAVEEYTIETESYTITTRAGIEKNVNIVVDKFKLISWEDERKMTFEQYDSQNVLVDRVIYDKTDKTATSSYNKNKYGDSEFIVDETSPVLIDNSNTISPRSFSYVGQVKVFNPLVRPVVEKQMKVYEEAADKRTVTYDLPSTVNTAAQWAINIGIGLALKNVFAGKIILAIVSAGLGLIVGNMINVIMPVRLAADRATCSYYGQDSVTSNKSMTYSNTGYRYYITDTLSSKLHELYADGNVFNLGGNYIICNALGDNLYGVNFQYTDPI